MKDKSRSEALRPPRHCPACSQDLSQYPYYQLIPSLFARKLLTLARALIAVMTVVFLHLLFSGSFFPSHSGASGYFIIAFICGPSLVIYSVTIVLPRTRRVICLHCSWFHDYPFSLGTFEARSEAT